jgi:cytochrome c2
MNARIVGMGLLGSLALAAPAVAQDKDIAEGEKLYVEQCQICHGKAGKSQTSERAAPRPGLLQLALRDSGLTAIDVPWGGMGHADAPAQDARIAFAPPFGPNLQGVYGRPAGTVAGYEYSSTFLKTLKGMEWNDAALDVWITNPQAWVPGVYMYYKQPDAELRRKIIAYLKANR